MVEFLQFMALFIHFNMKLKIKLYFRPTSKDNIQKEWHLCILIVNGQLHATADIRSVYGEPDEINVGTSTNGLNKYGTLLEFGPYKEEGSIPENFEMREIEAEVLETDWKNYGISHTYLKHKDIIP